MNAVASKSLPRWRTDAFLAGTIALNYGNRGILPAVFPAMRAELHLSDIAFGLLGSLFFWSYAICAPVTGMLGNRYSRRLLVLVSLVAWSATSVLSGVANGLLALAILRVAFGVAESLYLPAATALQADHHGPETRTLAMGLNTLAQSGGAVLGAACAGFIAERWGWRYAFGAVGFAGIVLALSSPRMLSDAPAAAASAHPPRAKVGEAISYLIRDPTYLMLVADEMLSGVAVWIFFFWLPLFLYESYGIKMGAAGFSGMAMLQISTMAGTVLGTWISHKLPRMSASRRLLLFAVSFIAAAPCLLCFLFHPSYLVVTVAISAFSLMRATGAVYELPLLCDVVPPAYRSTAVGLLISGACSAGGIGVLVAAFLKQRLGLTGVFASLSGVCALAGITLLIGYLWFIGRDVAKADAWANNPPGQPNISWHAGPSPT